MKPNRSRSAVLRGLPLALLLVLGGVGLWLTFGLYAAPVPARKPAAYPAWWFQREVIPANDATKASTTYPGDYPPAADYAVLTQGQLKHLATAAFDELQAHLPGGAGPAVTELVKGWYVLDGDAFHLDAQGHRVALASPQTNDFAPVTHGQLKEVAHYFFDRLQAELYYPADQPYPWDAAGARPPADHAVANLGQAKNLFQFDLTTDTIGDGIPDWWKRAHGLPTTKPVAKKLSAGGRVTNLAAFKRNLDPNDPDPQQAAMANSSSSPPVIISVIEEEVLVDQTTLDGSNTILIKPAASEPKILNGDFQEGGTSYRAPLPANSTESLALERWWYVKEIPGTTAGGWRAIGGERANLPITDPTSRAELLQVEVQQQLNDYVFPPSTPPDLQRDGKLNRYCELASHWERIIDKDTANPKPIKDNDGNNPSENAKSDRSLKSDHGIWQNVTLARGRWVLAFDYRGRPLVDNRFSVWAEGGSSTDPQYLLKEKDADSTPTDEFKRAFIPFIVSGGDPSQSAVTFKLCFDIAPTTPPTNAESFGVFIDNVVVFKVDFDSPGSPALAYGYDKYEPLSMKYFGDNSNTPDETIEPKYDFISVEKNQNTNIKVTIEGLADLSKIFFTSEDDTKFTVPSHITSSGQNLQITGKNKDKTNNLLYARVGSATGPIVNQLGVCVYKKKVPPEYKHYNVRDTGSVGTDLLLTVGVTAVNTWVNGVFKQAVADVTLVDAGNGDLPYDSVGNGNGNGKLDIYMGFGNSEANLIHDSLPGGFPAPKIPVVHVHGIRLLYKVTNIAADKKTLTIDASEDKITEYFKQGTVYKFHDWGTDSLGEGSISTVNAAAKTVVLSGEIDVARFNANSFGFYQDVAGYYSSAIQGDPMIFVTDQTDVDRYQVVVAHEIGHTTFLGEMIDTASNRNIMFGQEGDDATSDLPVQLRYRPLPDYYKRTLPDDKKMQWGKVPRD